LSLTTTPLSPAIPHIITNHYIKIRHIHHQHYHPATLTNNAPSSATEPEITLPISIQPRNSQNIFIGLHTTHTLQHQKFTWNICFPSTGTYINGPVEYIVSQTCSTIRGGLISLLKATKYLNRPQPSIHTPNNNTIITVCSRDPKLLRRLRQFKKYPSTAKNSLDSECELFQEISGVSHNFRHYHTHLSNKNDDQISGAYKTVTACTINIDNTNSPSPTDYSPNGQATLWYLNEEVSDNLEQVLRNAAGTTGIRKYMQTKYKWEPKTFETIHWTLHGRAMTSLSHSQMKTTTQMIHEWLPVNGHAGQTKNTAHQSYPLCSHYKETQDHFFSCNITELHWHTAITDHRLSIIDKYLPAQLANILRWAILNYRQHNRQYPTSDIDLPYTRLIQ
jgi:hypothetical protein